MGKDEGTARLARSDNSDSASSMSVSGLKDIGKVGATGGVTFFPLPRASIWKKKVIRSDN